MNNLASDPIYASTVTQLQNAIIHEIMHTYVKPQSRHLENWLPEAIAAAEGGDSWATGWCKNVTFTV